MIMKSSVFTGFASILMLSLFISAGQCSYTKRDYASWIDFDNGRWFTIYHLAPPLRPWGDVCDQMANRAFRYLVLGNTADRDYFIEKQMALANESYADIFLGGAGAHAHGDRIGQALAEVYIAMRHTMNPAQRAKVEKWYHDFAQYTWENSGYANHQATKAGFYAVVGYMTGDNDMLNKARKFLSYEDTWTIQEDSRHYAGLILERMMRIELFTHNFNIPQSCQPNLAQQMRWILSTFPHNGFNPPFGDCWIQNEADHYMEGLIAGSYFLNDVDIELAGNCKWLAEKMFEYGKDRSITGYDDLKMPMPSFIFQVNPVYLYWFLDESIVAKKPDINSYGSKVVHRLRTVKGDVNFDTDLASFVDMIDKIIHRDSWDEDAIFVMVDPVHRTYKNHENGAGNSITSISYGGEEFITGKILARFNTVYTQNSVADTPSDPRRNYGASLDSFTDNPDYSRSVTTLEGWSRTVTLYKTGDRRIEVKDYLPKSGNVYWHLQGIPTWKPNKVILNVNGIQMEVRYCGHESCEHQDIDTWGSAEPPRRWGNTGNPDRQLKLYRSSPGTINTTFRPLKSREIDPSNLVIMKGSNATVPESTAATDLKDHIASKSGVSPDIVSDT